MSPIDWTPFDRWLEQTCECLCGATFRSHAKFVATPPHIEARKSCPSCGSSDLRAARSDVETSEI